jgi:hypothetical protein
MIESISHFDDRVLVREDIGHSICCILSPLTASSGLARTRYVEPLVFCFLPDREVARAAGRRGSTARQLSVAMALEIFSREGGDLR